MVYSKMSVIQTKKFQTNMFVFWTDVYGSAKDVYCPVIDVYSSA
jgi:hypothetical protein